VIRKHTRFDPFLRSSYFRFGALALAFLAWTIFYQNVYWDPDHFLVRDNSVFQYPFFKFFVNYVRAFSDVPRWVYHPDGGTWFEILSNNYQLFLPHRIVGYGLGLIFPNHLNVVYKASFLILGHGLYLFAIYKCLYAWLKSEKIAWFGLILSWLTAITIGNFHQEQALGTVFFIPFIWWFLARYKKHNSMLIATALCIGWSLHCHYPQLLVTYLGIVFIALIVQNPRMVARVFIQKLKTPQAYIALGIIVLSLVPILYNLAIFDGKIVSTRTLRNQFAVESVSHYYAQTDKRSSVSPVDFRYYLNFFNHKSKTIDMFGDENVFFLSHMMPVAILFLVFFPIPWKRFHLTCLIGLSLCCIGIYGPVPGFLWHILPGMQYFRQWYHFVSFLNLHLLFVQCLILYWVFSGQERTRFEKSRIIAMVIIIEILIYSQNLAGLSIFLAFGFLAVRSLWLTPPRWVLHGLFSCVIVGSLYWATEKLPTLAFHGTQNCQGTAVNKLFCDPMTPVALPKHSNSAALKSLGAQSKLIAINKNGGFQPLKAFELKGTDGGLTIQINELSDQISGLLFTQFNDGRWLDEHGKTLEIGPFGSIKLPYQAGKTSYTIRRRATLWWWLMGLFFLVSVGLLAQSVWTGRKARRSKLPA